ncbi:hypothetical protein K470DRAFT_264192 [Piedraia hortae CBS 480.64]|uniref:BZIP domain-containing protein n=1 Tax=Piedraia hortae CBS 480.64 TaxID=1314780 RepID=A0A6A7C270_9PEZI|nr:hypothetical protein K470DRAFT_264192 [Piedraia hortae CBS 480.64]
MSASPTQVHESDPAASPTAEALPKRKGGRTKKYTTEEQKKERNRKAQSDFRLRRQNTFKTLSEQNKVFREEVSTLEKEKLVLQEHVLALTQENAALKAYCNNRESSQPLNSNASGYPQGEAVGLPRRIRPGDSSSSAASEPAGFAPTGSPYPAQHHSHHGAVSGYYPNVVEHYARTMYGEWEPPAEQGSHSMMARGSVDSTYGYPTSPQFPGQYGQ